ncbi:unnamed protein product [Cylindrotheca closterium]|uniref:Uncharacterized protein n=1 Tax=Cylindrotheca closterium TaxID=2856 RepID=A0AAD2FEI9_9STRA|nr:unnamed protein product [Cylindrotheca closterium]
MAQLESRQHWHSDNTSIQSGSNSHSNNNLEFTISKVVEILVEDFIAPLLCFGSNFRSYDKSKARRPDGKSRSFSRQAKSLLTEDESTVASTDVDSYNQEESVDTRDYNARLTQERIIFDHESMSDELTDFRSLTSLRRRLTQDEDDEEDHRDVVGYREDPLLEHEELRNELRTIRQQSSRLQNENTNLRRLYETSKLSHNVQESVNQRLKSKNQLLHKEGKTLQLELDEMKGHVETLRLEQSIIEKQMMRKQ